MCVVQPSTQTRSIFKIAHSSSRDFISRKMESLWDVLPPELQEYILQRKTKLEQRDKKRTLAEEIGELI